MTTVNGLQTGFETRDGEATIEIGLGVTVMAVPIGTPDPGPLGRWLSISIQDKNARYHTRGEIAISELPELIRTLTEYLAIAESESEQ